MRLVQGMRDQMQQRRGECTKADLQHHETHLGNGRIRQGYLDRGLGHHHQRAKQRGDSACQQQAIECGPRQHQHIREAQQQEAAGVDDAGVQQRRHGRGCLHHFQQPAVQRKLGALEHARHHQQRSQPMDAAGNHRGVVQGLCTLLYRREIQTAKRTVREHHGTDQAQITDPAGDEFLARSQDGGRALAIEQQQAIQAQRCRRPCQRELEQVARQDQQQDARQGQAQTLHESTVARVAVQVVAAVADHHGAHEGHQQRHRGAQRVKLQCEADAGEADRSGAQYRAAECKLDAGRDHDQGQRRHARCPGHACHQQRIPIRPCRRNHRDGGQRKGTQGQKPELRFGHGRLPGWTTGTVARGFRFR